jgi:hypothetical protein
MIVRIHGLDWQAYAGQVMPALARWLIEGEESAVSQLYEQTRSAREDLFLPPALQTAGNWTRARLFVQQLPRGIHARHEYQMLCSAEQFSGLSDKYIHRHPPQLYAHSDAVCAVWGALVEEYCQSWFTLPPQTGKPEKLEPLSPEMQTSREEVVSLLHAAGLNALAREVNEPTHKILFLDDKEDDLDEDEELKKPLGMVIGHKPAMLHLRGWLATFSVRAMALFELLACERRYMPFGYRVGEPYESYIGYLTPDEVWHLAACLRDAQAPDQAQAEEDYTRFRLQKSGRNKAWRMVDEVQPTYADALLKSVRLAAQYGLGLICNLE